MESKMPEPMSYHTVHVFAGHPTLGAAWAVRHHSRRREVPLGEGVGEILTWFDSDDDTSIVWMEQKAPEFGSSYSADGALVGGGRCLA